MAIIFDGYKLAAKKEKRLKEKVSLLGEKGVLVKIAAILFVEDEASRIYSSFKKEVAERVGIEYLLYEFSFSSPLEEVQAKIEELNQDQSITGIIIQKPWTKNWLKLVKQSEVEKTAEDFRFWWQALVSKIATEKSYGVNKDIDGLHPETLKSIKEGTWMEKKLVLPATVRAVLTIIKFYKDNYEPGFCYCSENTLIVGKSDLIGKPLYWHIGTMLTCGITNPGEQKLEQNGGQSEGQSDPNKTIESSEKILPKKIKAVGVKLLGKKGFKDLLEQKNLLKDFGLIISATGQKNLINGTMLANETVLIDVGEPNPDLDFSTCQKKAKFITPVPGGVGPMTVVSLLANAVDLLKSRSMI